MLFLIIINKKHIMLMASTFWCHQNAMQIIQLAIMPNNLMFKKLCLNIWMKIKAFWMK